MDDSDERRVDDCRTHQAFDKHKVVVRDSERSPKDQIVDRKENLRHQTCFSLRRAVASFVNAMQKEDKSPSLQKLVGELGKES